MTKKNIKYWFEVIGAIGGIIVIPFFACHIITDWTDWLPQSNWYILGMLLGWSLILLSDAVKSYDQESPNGFLLWFLLLFFTIHEMLKIDHFTTPMIAVIAISAVLMLSAIVLILMKRMRGNTSGAEPEKEKNQGNE